MVEDRPRAEVDPRQFGPACLDRGPGIRRLPPVGRRALLLGGAMRGLLDDPATSWTSWWTPPPPRRRPGRRTGSGAWRTARRPHLPFGVALAGRTLPGAPAGGVFKATRTA